MMKLIRANSTSATIRCLNCLQDTQMALDPTASILGSLLLAKEKFAKTHQCDPSHHSELERLHGSAEEV